ncbi:MAG TPA: hypothetical protein VGE77_05900 [Nocardioides sp.]
MLRNPLVVDLLTIIAAVVGAVVLTAIFFGSDADWRFATWALVAFALATVVRRAFVTWRARKASTPG